MISKNYNCRECGKEFKTAYALAEHLRSAHQIQMQEYYDKYFNDGTEGKCECCGKPTKFIRYEMDIERNVKNVLINI